MRGRFTCVSYRRVRDGAQTPSFGDSYFMKLVFSANLQEKKKNRMKSEGTKRKGREKNVRAKQVTSIFP